MEQRWSGVRFRQGTWAGLSKPNPWSASNGGTTQHSPQHLAQSICSFALTAVSSSRPNGQNDEAPGRARPGAFCRSYQKRLPAYAAANGAVNLVLVRTARAPSDMAIVAFL